MEELWEVTGMFFQVENNKKKNKWLKYLLGGSLPVVGILLLCLMVLPVIFGASTAGSDSIQRIVEFQGMPWEVIQKSYEEHLTNKNIDYISLVAYANTVSGLEWDKYDLNDIHVAATSGKPIEQLLTKSQKETYDELYPMLKDIMCSYVGNYEDTESTTETVSDSNSESAVQSNNTVENSKQITKTVTVQKYGVKDFYPFAEGFTYDHTNSFGAARSYGGERQHEGNDIMAPEMTPIVAIEDGWIKDIGWNEYGGYRIGIRTYDEKRYYYYAHMYYLHPYADGMAVGTKVTAGTVIGFVGATGYSKVEGTTGLFATHLHLQIGVDYDINGKKERVYFDPYPFMKFIENNRKATLKKIDNFHYIRD